MNKSPNRMKVAILGGTGLVGRRLAALLVGHPMFELGMVVGSETTSGMAYGAVWRDKENALRDHYGDFWNTYDFPRELDALEISSFEQLVRSSYSVIFSTIASRFGVLEDTLFQTGRTLFSNSPYKRLAPETVLTVPELIGNLKPGSRVKYPNCVASGVVLVLKPVSQLYGLAEVVLTTYQSLSGRGDAKYPREAVVGNVLPLHGSSENTEEFIRAEVSALLEEDFRLSVTCNRVAVQEGHLVEVGIKTRRPVSNIDDLQQGLIDFNPLEGMPLPSRPSAPLVLLGKNHSPTPREDAFHEKGMAVAVGNLDLGDEVFDIRLTIVVNNLIRGAAGGILLSAELWSGPTENPN